MDHDEIIGLIATWLDIPDAKVDGYTITDNRGEPRQVNLLISMLENAIEDNSDPWIDCSC